MRGTAREREGSQQVITVTGAPAAVAPSCRAPARRRRQRRAAAAAQVPEITVTVCRDDHHAATDQAITRAWLEYKQSGSIAARDLLIIHYMSGHVRRIAHRLGAQLPKQIDPDDLVQHVYRGLVRLIERFDPQRDVQFETFSSRRLVGAMRDYLRDIDTSGRQSRQRAKRLQEVESRFWAEHGRRPDADELRARLGVNDDDEFRKFIDDARAPLTVSFASGGSSASDDAGGGWDDADGFAGFHDRRAPAAPPLLGIERDDLRRWLTEGLSRRDRLIVILYYYEQMTMKEVGQTLGCSESRVSQRLDSIIKCLRSRLTRMNAAGELA